MSGNEHGEPIATHDVSRPVGELARLMQGVLDHLLEDPDADDACSEGCPFFLDGGADGEAWSKRARVMERLIGMFGGTTERERIIECARLALALALIAETYAREMAGEDASEVH
jgi:hypothetical protein